MKLLWFLFIHLLCPYLQTSHRHISPSLAQRLLLWAPAHLNSVVCSCKQLYVYKRYHWKKRQTNSLSHNFTKAATLLQPYRRIKYDDIRVSWHRCGVRVVWHLWQGVNVWPNRLVWYRTLQEIETSSQALWNKGMINNTPFNTNSGVDMQWDSQAGQWSRPVGGQCVWECWLWLLLLCGKRQIVSQPSGCCSGWWVKPFLRAIDWLFLWIRVSEWGSVIVKLGCCKEQVKTDSEGSSRV